MSGKIYLLLLVAVITVSLSNSQRVLSRREMQNLLGYKGYDYPKNKPQDVHTCAYLVTKGNKYNGNRQSYAYLECNCVRHINDCNNQKMTVERKCCPGFKKFNYNGNELCKERIFPRKSFKSALVDHGANDASTALFSPSYGAAFNDTNPAGVYTLFVVRDGDDMKLGSISQSTASAPDYTKSTYLHVAPGRYYTQSLQQAHGIPTLYKPAGKAANVKFTRYSNGIMCVECSMIKEANHEAANGVIHFLDFPLFTSANQKSIAEILQADHSYFWNVLPQNVKDQLSGSSCSGWFTVFVPNEGSFQAGSDAGATAANHIINGLWCSSALVSKSSSNMATLAGDVLQLRCSGSNRDDITVFSNGRTASVDGATRGTSFDRMATNGVIHVISGTLQPRASQNFRFAVQLDTDSSAEDSRYHLFNDFEKCRIKLEEGKKYIVLVPTAAAMRRFMKHKSTREDATMYKRNLGARCQLMKYHILKIKDGDVIDLERAMHVQKSYETLLEDNNIFDFLLAEGQKFTPYFMNARVVNSEKFSKGQVYNIDRLLLPSAATKWRNRRVNSAVKRTMRQRETALARMEAAADGPSTFFVAPRMENADTKVMAMHTSKILVWTSYMRIGDTMELPSQNADVTLVLRREAKYFFTLGYNGLPKAFQAKVQGANNLRQSGVVWYINKPLPLPSL